MLFFLIWRNILVGWNVLYFLNFLLFKRLFKFEFCILKYFIVKFLGRLRLVWSLLKCLFVRFCFRCVIKLCLRIVIFFIYVIFKSLILCIMIFFNKLFLIFSYVISVLMSEVWSFDFYIYMCVWICIYNEWYLYS